MKKTFKILSLIMVFAFLFLSASCAEKDEGVAPKDFSSNGMTITLTNEFSQKDEEGFTVCFDSGAIVIFCLREEFQIKNGLFEMSAEDYAQSVREVNADLDTSDVYTKDGYAYIEYDFNNLLLGKTFSYYCTVFKTEDAFWMIQFSCEKFAYETFKPKFEGWAKTIVFE